MTTADCLDISGRSIIAVIGCGGKTTLIEQLAIHCRNRRVLVSPTTKMFPLNVDGVSLSGRLNAETGKLEALPEDELAALTPQYDMVLLEADGSCGLPCKGWREDEPVVPGWCTHTAGIVTMSALGRSATLSVVHRLPEFLTLTGLREGASITLEALEAMICAPHGMFKNSAGRKYLFVNQVEDEQTACIARKFLQDLRKKYPSFFTRLLYGSARQDAWSEV